MYCNKCGVEVNARDKRCWNCGTDLEKITPVFHRPDIERRKKFWQKTWFSILMFFLFWPVGLVLLWKNKVGGEVGRVILVGGITVFMIFALMGLSTGRKSDVAAAKKNAVIKSEEVTYVCDIDGIGKVKGEMVSYVGLTVYRVAEVKSIVTEDDIIKPRGKFVIVNVAVTNRLAESFRVNNKDFLLTDEYGRTFSPSEQAASALIKRDGNPRGLNDKVMSGQTACLEIPFDVPLKAPGLKLRAIKFNGRNIDVPVKVEPVK